ncbi:MAG TPA: hypothetical protein VL200_06505 [Lacunisphaera sp.]|nr:hypothetical protein [Lacunisphaera sp.]
MRTEDSSAGSAPATPRKWLLTALAVAAIAFALQWVEINWSDLPLLLDRVNRPVALLLMATLPVFGFPISAVYLAAGALFGPGRGAVVVAGVTLVHLAATHALGRSVFRGVLERGRQRWHRRLPDVPPDEFAALAAMVVLVPGPPYVVRNGLLVFAGVPLRVLAGVAWPLYVVRSAVTLFLGDLGADPSWRALAILGGVAAVKLAISVALFRRLQHHLRPPGGEAPAPRRVTIR